jgi:cytochrome oxidase Cu insertion factor (SCO1/SenC/PrrC family)
MNSSRNTLPIRIVRSLAIIATLVGVITVVGCRQQAAATDERGGFTVSDAPDVLSDVTLIDQHGRKVALPSLRGKPLLFDFIYTSCPGPCLMLTARMKSVANHLGPILGSEAKFVSVTVDPEHDHPSDLLTYAKEQGAERNGWLFLTGPPAEIDRLMARFKLQRQREPDGSVDHVLEFFLVGPDGHLMLQYVAFDTNPLKLAGDVEQAVDGKRLVESAQEDSGENP